MSNIPQSDLQKAVEAINPTDLEQNLAQSKQVELPEKLDNSQTTPFIDKTLRTDK